MKIEPRTLKGFRDFLPADARKRQYVINILKGVFESYGFEPLETPALEYEDILLGKYGEEADKLLYKFEDNGARKVAMRYDQTVPLARVIAQYQNELPFPFKRYQIQNVWRAENTQKGRFREFLQCDIDTIGNGHVGTDAEILAIINDSLKKLGFVDYKIHINDRMNFEGIDPSAILTIDKLQKIGHDGVKHELKEKGFEENILNVVLDKKPTERIQFILDNPDVTGDKVVFDPTLARGLDYYTGIIIEVEVEGFDAGSVGGGGRYDGLIGMFSSTNYPAVGFAFGFDRLMEAMEEKGLFPPLSTTKALIVVQFAELEKETTKLAQKMRQAGINTEVYPNSNTEMFKQFKYAEKKNIPYVTMIISNAEVELRSKNEDGSINKETLNLEQLIEKLQ